MYVREKTARGHTYLYLVESEREGGRVRQRIIRALGRKDVLLASGELERLAASLARHCDRAIIPVRHGGRPHRLHPHGRATAVWAALGTARHCRSAGAAAHGTRF